MFKKLPIGIQFVSVIAILVIAGVIAALQFMKEISVAEARNQARTVADMVDNVGTWASQYSGVWVRGEVGKSSGAFLEREAAMPRESMVKQIMQASGYVGLAESDLKMLEDLGSAYHRKNPALVQRELADVTQASAAKAKFRMTSDKYMNPNNAPNGFEIVAIETLRQSGETEFAKVEGSSLLYARKLVVTKGCLACHGKPEDAPKAVRAQYGTVNGYGYQIGDVAGIISVSVPLAGVQAGQLLKNIQLGTSLAVLAFGLAFALAIAYVHVFIIRPTKKLQKFASEVSSTSLENLVVAPQLVEDEGGSSNEIHGLSNAIKLMYRSIRILHQEGLTESRPKVTKI